MATLSGSDDDLTTDAIPSPPRDEVNNAKDTEENVEPEHVYTRPKVKNTNKIPKVKGFSKTKKGGPTAFASVINISNANGIHIGSNYNVYLNNKQQNSQKNEYIITEAIQSLFDNLSLIDRKHLTFISPHIDEQWRITARALNYSDGQISQFYEDHIRAGIKEVIYQLLLDWMQNEDSSATVARLSKTLWESGQQDAVKRWSENVSR